MNNKNKLTPQEFNRLFDKAFSLKKLEKKIKNKEKELLLTIARKSSNDIDCFKEIEESVIMFNLKEDINKERNEIIDFLIQSSQKNEELFEFRRFYGKLEELR